MKRSYQSLPRSQRALARSQRGATAVEFAIVAPIFFLFLLASFEFGWMNVLRHTADNAAYEAARAAMVPGATAADAVSKANSILSIVKARKAQVTVTPTVITDTTDHVTVTIDVPMSSNALAIPRFTGTKTIHCTATLRTERVESN
jgi:Flp pilus assembly protein TadG